MAASDELLSHRQTETLGQGLSNRNSFLGDQNQPTKTPFPNVRFSYRTLLSILEKSVNDYKRKPLAYMEWSAFKLCTEAYYGEERTLLIPTIQSIRRLYHLLKLGSAAEPMLELIDIKVPTARMEYELAERALGLVTELAVCYGLFKVNNYLYRLSGRTLSVKVLDLEELCKQPFSMQVLWLALAVRESPLNELSDQTLYTSSIGLEVATNDLFARLFKINSGTAEEVETLGHFLAVKETYFSKDLQITPDKSIKTPPKYQSLKVPFLARFLKKQAELPQSVLRDTVLSFELAYREFEKALISTFLVENTEEIQRAAGVDLAIFRY